MRVAKRLREAGLSDERFIQLRPGSKEPRSHNQYGPNELDEKGGYGVYSGDGLVIIDIDPYEVEELPEWLDDLPPTFTVKSPHDGEHRYYATDEPITNHRFDGGSIRADNWYAVGPGTTLTSCDKDWHNCSKDDAGGYKIHRETAIATITTAAFSDTDAESPTLETNADLETITTDITAVEEIDAPFGKLQTRLRTFLDDETRKALWVGRYTDAGFDDRSDAEASLAYHLGWFFEGDPDVVRQLMSLACNQHPLTDRGEKRKWIDRPDASYHEPTLRLPDYADPYEPPMSPVGKRPKVSFVARDDVMLTVAEIGPATTTEIANHDRVDVKKRQVLNALNELEDVGIVEWEKRGRAPVYYIVGCEHDRV